MTQAAAARWERLRATLAEAGVETTVDTRKYQEGYRPVWGTTYSISVDLPTPGWSVDVRDQWWRKNDNVWIGWMVSLVDADSIVVRDYPLTKKRSEVRDAVKAALALHDEKTGAKR